MVLNISDNLIVVAHNFAIQRMVCTKLVENSVVTAGADVIEVFITLTDYRFPNKELRCSCLSKQVAATVLTAPVGTDSTRMAVLHNSTDKQLDVVGTDGVIVGRGVIVPIVLVTVCQLITCLKRCAGFNTVANISCVRTYAVNEGVIGSTCTPTVHKA